jgi:hypothetical protein
MAGILPPASPFLVEEFERLKRKIWESLIEADVRVRYLARIPKKSVLWRKSRALLGDGTGEPEARLAALEARWSSLLERYEALWNQLSVEDQSEVDRYWRALQREHRALIAEEAEQHRLDKGLAVECEAEALQARGGLEAEKTRLLAEIERLRQEIKKHRNSGSSTLDFHELMALQDGLRDSKAKYRAFGGTLPEADEASVGGGGGTVLDSVAAER